MSDFESRVRDALEAGAEQAPTPVGLVEGARVRARQRRRSTLAAAAAAVVAAVAVPFGVVALAGDGAGGDPDRAAASGAADPGPTRVESWHRVSVDVPAWWGYGSRTAWCAGGDAASPRVERPGVRAPLISCTPSAGHGLSFSSDLRTTFDEPSGSVWRYSDDDPSVLPGTWGGLWYDDEQAVTVNAADRETVQAILDSVRVNETVDPNGCPVERQEGHATESARLSVCRYDADGLLEQSELLSPGDTEAALAALEAAPPGDPELDASCAAEQLPRLVVQMLSQSLSAEVVLQAPCPYRPGITGGGEQFSDLTADVVYWALSPGWSGTLEQGVVPLPDRLREVPASTGGVPVPEPEEPTTAPPGGPCPQAFPSAVPLDLRAVTHPPAILCRWALSDQAESGGTWNLVELRPLTDAEERVLAAAIEACPDGVADPGPNDDLYAFVRVEGVWWVERPCPDVDAMLRQLLAPR